MSQTAFRACRDERSFSRVRVDEKMLRAELSLLPRFLVPFRGALLFREIVLDQRSVPVRLSSKFSLEFRKELLAAHRRLHVLRELREKSMDGILNALTNVVTLRVVESAA